MANVQKVNYSLHTYTRTQDYMHPPTDRPFVHPLHRVHVSNVADFRMYVILLVQGRCPWREHVLLKRRQHCRHPHGAEAQEKSQR
jgi:hypothetical protein